MPPKKAGSKGRPVTKPTRVQPRRKAKGPYPPALALDPLFYPHILDLILSHLSLKDSVATSNVCTAWREHLTPRRLRHLSMHRGQLFPRVASSSFEGFGKPIAWVPKSPVDGPLAPSEAVLGLVRQYCTVLDLVGIDPAMTMFPTHWSDDNSQRLQDFMSSVEIHVVRRFSDCSVPHPVNTIVDFAPYWPLSAGCKRYVVPNVLDDHAWMTKFSFSTPSGIQAPDGDFALEDLTGLEEVVIIFIADTTCLHRSRKLLQNMSGPLGKVQFKLVGLLDKCQGQSLEAQLEGIIPSLACTPEVARRVITFYTHEEYRQEVGESQYRLETDEEAVCW